MLERIAFVTYLVTDVVGVVHQIQAMPTATNTSQGPKELRALELPKLSRNRVPHNGAFRLGQTVQHLVRSAERLALDDVRRGLVNTATGKTKETDSVIAWLQERRGHRQQR